MITKTLLSNGLRIVLEPTSGVRSVAVGVWVDVGSRDEAEGTYGASHFLEHLLFKGTERWSARAIAESLDAVGGDFNAFTGKEQTAFYVRTLDEDVPLGMDILADITQRPAFRPEEVESERNVVVEEINMYEDSPDELVHDVFGQAILPGHPLGRPIVGTKESIAAMTPAVIAEYFATRYRPDRTVIAAAGNIDPGGFAAEVAGHWGDLLGTAPVRDVHRPSPAVPRRVDERPTEQAHVVVGTRTMARDDDRRHALTVLNHVFGGGMSSRLFQEVREKRGLAYSVYSYRSLYQETGIFAVYAGTAPGRAEETLDVVLGEIRRLAAGMTPDELAAAKGHVRGSLALSQEDTLSRMSRIGRAELTLGRVPEIDDLVAEIDSVTLDDVNALAAELAESPRTLTVIGPFPAGAFAEVVA